MKLSGSIAKPRSRRNFLGNAAGASLAVGLHVPAILAQTPGSTSGSVGMTT